MEENKKVNKLKQWFEDHKDEIKSTAGKILWYGLGCTVGCVIATKANDYAVSNGLRKFHQVGLVKFFNPQTGSEVGPMECSKIAETMHKNGYL